MTEPKDTWEPLSEPTARILARWDEEQRRAFERLCERDGVTANQQRKSGVKNESVV